MDVGVTTSMSYAVPGGALHALVLGNPDPAAPTVLAAHGITANARSWAAVAAALPASWRLVALDLRGRGGSRDLPAPYGLRAHATDLIQVALIQVAESSTSGPVVLAGHSMGAFVAVHAAHQRPDLFSRVVLVDGGVALPLPADADPDEVLAAALGPALERLRQVYPSVDDYVAFFRAHPALADHWSPVVEEYVRYDALVGDDGIRSRAVEAAVRADGRDLLVTGAEFEPEVAGTPLPVDVLAAPYGMFGQPGGLLPTPGLEAYDALPHVSVETVPDVNHYTILFDPAGAAAVATAITR